MDDAAWYRWLEQMTLEMSGAALYRFASNTLFSDGRWSVTQQEAAATGHVLDDLRSRAALQGAGETLQLQTCARAQRCRGRARPCSWPGPGSR